MIDAILTFENYILAGTEKTPKINKAPLTSAESQYISYLFKMKFFYNECVRILTVHNMNKFDEFLDKLLYFTEIYEESVSKYPINSEINFAENIVYY